MTYGGYSTSIVVDEAFVLRIPARLDLAAAAPLLCAGITTYSPLRHWKVGPGPEGRHRRPRRPRPHGREVRPRLRRPRRALHHLARQGRRTRSGSAPTRSWSRRTRTQMKKHAGSFDFILDTVSAAARHQRLPGAAEAGRHARAWSARRSTRCRSPALQPDHAAPQLRRLRHRRHRRDPGDARLLRRSTASSPTSR